MTAKELFELLKDIKIGSNICKYSLKKCEEIVEITNDINRLKLEKNATILAHSYVSPEIIYTVADFTGDSYKLSKDAINTKADTIIFSAVTFMAETAKLLNPQKKVYVPSNNGCSLADSITKEDIITLKKEYFDYTFMCYINTTAEVKAFCDVCVTSSNVYNIVENYPSDKIFFLPDKLMADNIIEEMKKRNVKKTIKSYSGTCYVHEEYDPEMIEFLKKEHEDLEVAVHPECRKEVVQKADFVGSTSQMMEFVKSSESNHFVLLTECGLSDRLQIELKGTKKLIGSCTMCRYMKNNTLGQIKDILLKPRKDLEIILKEEIIEKARKCIDNMFLYAE